MRIKTWLLYLVGNRQAILEIAAERRWLGIGFLFVLSAGLARTYDGEDLLREPWHLLIPYVASLLAAFVLFGIQYFQVAGAPSFPEAFRAFLSLFWLTAPLAWLYAIPYERMLSPLQATQANVGTLGVVALWRVALMMRVLSVLMGHRPGVAFFLVMSVADAEVLLALYLAPLPIVDFMGGIRLSPGDKFLQGIAHSIGFLGGCSLPFWLIGAWIVDAPNKPTWQGWQEAPADNVAASTLGVQVVAWSSVLIWCFILPWTQPEQQLRYRVEQQLRTGRIEDALSEMSAHASTDFPPHWDPLPRVGWDQLQPPLLKILEVLVQEPAAPWVQGVYLHKLDAAVRSDYYWHGQPYQPERILELLPRIPGGEILLEQLEQDPGDNSYMLRSALEQRRKKAATSGLPAEGDH